MQVKANPNYRAEGKEPEAVNSPFYWIGEVLVQSSHQHLKKIESDILASGCVSAAQDIRLMWVSASGKRANVLTMGTDLEADSISQAMIKLSGLVLLSMRKAGVDIEAIQLEDGRLASGIVLDAATTRDPKAGIYDPRYSLTPQLEDIFTDLQASMVRDGLPATY